MTATLQASKKNKEQTYQITTNLFFLNLPLTVAVWLVRDCGLLPYQVTANFEAGYCASKITETLIYYTACYRLVLFFLIILCFYFQLFVCLPCVGVGELFGWFWLCVAFLCDQPMCLTTKRWQLFFLFVFNLLL